MICTASVPVTIFRGYKDPGLPRVWARGSCRHEPPHEVSGTSRRRRRASLRSDLPSGLPAPSHYLRLCHRRRHVARHCAVNWREELNNDHS